ncbi:MAG: CotH kinase family protein [Bacteroidota bacterium]|nr:CotH kinase family protein [Bacteroidota bacterium]
MNTRIYKYSFSLLVAGLFLIFCYNGSATSSRGVKSSLPKSDTKLKKDHPDYSKVFPSDKVNRIDLVIKASDWKKMTAEMEKNFGVAGKDSSRRFMSPPHGKMGEADSTGEGRFPMPPMEGGDPERMGPPPFEGGMPDSLRQGNFPPMDGMMPDSLHQGEFSSMNGVKSDSLHRGNFPAMGGMMPDSLHRGKFPPMGGMMPHPNNNFTPAYVPCTLSFEGKQWNSVGFRFKGNSSLMMSWMRGIKKLPFRLEFDKYKDSASNKKSYHFYGFNKLSFSNNTNDNSLLREKISHDIFREAGIKAPHTAFYRVYLDYGEGPVYFGLYTAVEIVEDTMLKDQFGDASGNCYKPEGPSAGFTGVFDSKSFEKKTNKKEADWKDVKKLFSILNSKTRLSDPEKWKKELETVFDVSEFMNWLAVNNTIQNWDTYGQMAHNYYIYNNPATNKFEWIPWDNNEAMGSKGRGMSLSLKEVSSNWPLIRFLMDQPEYAAYYKAGIKSLISGAFEPTRIKEKFRYYHNLISPYVVGENGEKKGYSLLFSSDSFEKSLSELEKHADNRNRAAKTFLGL